MSHDEPRWANGNTRRKLRNRLMLEGRPCWICVAAGKSGQIDYNLKFPHPYSFVVDEAVPVSRYWLGGYANAQACASDYGNLLAAHKVCNEWRGNKTIEETLQAIADATGKRKPSNGDVQPTPTPRILGDCTPTRDWRNFKPKG